MSLSGLLSQLLNGLADASALFLVAAGLSLIFGVTRVVNFAHGSFYMLGIYLAWSFTHYFGDGPGYWAGLLLAALATGLIGAAAELLVLKRLYRAPELFQLLATFALVLIIGDAALAIWGPEDLFAARAPGLSGAVEILGRRFPQYDLLLIVAGPVVLGLLWLLLMRTRWGRLLRAAAENRDMLAALGVNQAWLFTSAFTLGAFLAGLGGALAAPRVPATLGLDLEIIASAFVVVVVGGLGSIPGAFLAAVLSLFSVILALNGWSSSPAPTNLGWGLLLATWTLLGVGYSATQTPSGRLLRRSAHAEDRPAVFAAQFALSHACWLIAYPLAGWLGAALPLGALSALFAVVTIVATVLAWRLWPAGTAHALEHDHPDLPDDHPHLKEHGARHIHPIVIDDLHVRWPISTGWSGWSRQRLAERS